MPGFRENYAKVIDVTLNERRRCIVQRFTRLNNSLEDQMSQSGGDVVETSVMAAKNRHGFGELAFRKVFRTVFATIACSRLCPFDVVPVAKKDVACLKICPDVNLVGW